MVGWVRRLFRRRNDRRLFRYHDGNRWRRIDPLVATRALGSDPEFNWETHPPLVDKGDIEAIRVTANAVRRSFDVQAYSEDGGGLTEGESIALLLRFAAYTDSLKKSIDRSPTSSAPTGSPPASNSMPKQSADSPSISSEPSAASQPAFS